MASDFSVTSPHTESLYITASSIVCINEQTLDIICCHSPKPADTGSSWVCKG